MPGLRLNVPLAVVLSSCSSLVFSVNAFAAAPAVGAHRPTAPVRAPALPLPLRGGGSGRTDSPSIAKLRANAMADPVMPPPGGGSRVLVIGVAGGSGGGKSVFCTKLEKLVQQICPTIVISHDNYYKDKVDVDRECEGNWDCPTALHTSDLVRDLATLKDGGEAKIPIYSFADNARVRDQCTPRQFAAGTHGVLLVEGLMVLHDEELRSRMDIRVYVDCDEDTRFMRRLARDTNPVSGRGRTVADVYSAWARNVKPNHHKFVEPTKRYAHMIVPHHGLWADPGHLLAVGEDPSSLLDEYVNRVSLGERTLDGDSWDQAHDGKVAKALEKVSYVSFAMRRSLFARVQVAEALEKISCSIRTRARTCLSARVPATTLPCRVLCCSASLCCLHGSMAETGTRVSPTLSPTDPVGQSWPRGTGSVGRGAQ
jgi:uridine kinase